MTDRRLFLKGVHAGIADSVRDRLRAEPIESTVDQLPGLKLPKAFEQMLLRGNAERSVPRFKTT
jgi:hypothetical protein